MIKISKSNYLTNYKLFAFADMPKEFTDKVNFESCHWSIAKYGGPLAFLRNK